MAFTSESPLERFAEMSTEHLALEALLLCSCVLLGHYVYSKWTRLPKRLPEKITVKDEVPQAVDLPDPEPLLDFNLETATTRNHLYANKTVRWPYFQTMSHQPMHINDWIEIDKDLKWYIEEKTRVIEQQGKKVIDSLPENDEACAELLETLVDYLPKRYPTLFENIDCEGGGIWNKVTDEKLTGLASKVGVEALKVCSRLVEDDFLMGREREDGQVYFVGGLVAFPGFYLLSNKIGKSMRQVHMPVPHFNEKLLLSVERTLKRFKPNEPFERTSWEIVDDRNLFFHGIAELHNGGKLPEQMQAKDLFFRVDHQTFRKLPRTKGIIFGVHPIMKRLEDLEESPLVPALLVKVHEEAEKKLMDYKLAPLYNDIALPYLRELTEKQIKKGLIKGDEDVSRFREFIRQGEKLPSTQTSLTHPTESEILIQAAKAKAKAS